MTRLGQKQIYKSEESRQRALAHLSGVGGNPVWNKGLKGVMVSWNKGKKGLQTHTEEFKQNRRKAFTGKNNPRWKGGITPIHTKIRNSSEYKAKVQECFKRDNYICVECGVRGGWDKEKKVKIILNADHIKTFADHPELRFELSNLRTLCLECHKKTDSYLNRWNRKS